ncbi:MAG: FRG domain-containing protein [Nitrospirales bacterium]
MEPPKVIANWRQLECLHQTLLADQGRCLIYRGQREFRWDLATTLERAGRRFSLSPDLLPAAESWLITEFQRHAHRFATGLPEPVDRMRWMALMQHHGAPTRLLDCTYSFYVAMHFAIEHATGGQHCALWVIDQKSCWEHAKGQLPHDLAAEIEASPDNGKTPALQARVLENQVLGVVPDNPFSLDERLAVQQGVFLLPLDITNSMMANLQGVTAQAGDDAVRKYEICCTSELLRDALAALRRMNISRVSLFSGLDGLACSLENRIAGEAVGRGGAV